ncbi:MAG: hypothetical protein HC893_05065 [Chloroflexaceae bacterium]|nr:hypothetical protein [Chloroflexaceae bacterium]
MQSRELLHRLIYRALIEIREEAYRIQNKKLFHISDLIHNLPLQLERGIENKSYDEILSTLQVRATEKGSEIWLENAIKDETRQRDC